jgi:para-nitrobenzyl esterase
MTDVAIPPSSRIRLALAGGVIEGCVEAGVRRFLSVPYAAPMTPERRFREPQPVPPWQGVRDAISPGPSAPQTSADIEGVDWSHLLGDLTRTGPDYLSVNVWSGDDPRARRPVAVFVHGGSFVTGGKDAPIYNGSAFARDGVVCVTLNYRLGVEGFLPIPGVPTNLGLRDIIAALEWTRDTIALFGGDPANVTLFGESAGAACVALLMVSPAAQGLFRRAICQSGHGHLTRDVASMQKVVKRLARRLKISPDREGFASVPAEAMLPAQAWVMRPSLALDMAAARSLDLSFGARFAPVFGDDIVPERPFEAQRRGAGKTIELLTGTTSEEANLFFAPGGRGKRMRAWQAILFMRRAAPRARQVLEAYGLKDDGAKVGDVTARAMTDLMFRAPSRRCAELHKGRAWVYEFDWRSPALGGDLGAAHAVELPFVFDTLGAASGDESLLGPAPPQALADHIHRLWVDFATDGSLPWPTYEPSTRLVYSLTRGLAASEAATPAEPFLL